MNLKSIALTERSRTRKPMYCTIWLDAKSQKRRNPISRGRLMVGGARGLRTVAERWRGLFWVMGMFYIMTLGVVT